MPPNFSQEENGGEEKPTADGPDLAPLRTYKSDIENILKEGRTSTAGMVAAEATRRAGGPLPTEEEERSWKIGRLIAIGGAIILFFGGAGILSYFLFWKESKTNQVAVTAEKTIILVNAVKEISADNLNREGLIKAVKTARQETNLKIGEVEELRLTTGAGETKKILGAEDFLKLIEADAEPFLVRSLKDEFLLGLHIYTGGVKTFIIFKTNSFENTFAGMLQWEETMWRDLGKFVGTEPASEAAESALSKTGEQGTTTPLANQKIFWSDAVIQNKDVRTLKNAAGEIILFYSFVDDKTLIIAQSAASFREALVRLKTAALVR